MEVGLNIGNSAFRGQEFKGKRALWAGNRMDEKYEEDTDFS